MFFSFSLCEGYSFITEFKGPAFPIHRSFQTLSLSYFVSQPPLTKIQSHRDNYSTTLLL